MKCRYCNKELKNKNALAQHEIRCPKNSKRIPIVGAAVKGTMIGREKTSGFTGMTPWNKGKKGLQEAWNKGKKCPQISGNQGGRRQGSGRGKKGWYKGYWCDSSWELAYVIYNLDHDIKFERNHEKFYYMFEGKEHYWLPDFIVDGVYEEIKGYEDNKAKAKHTSFDKPLNILRNKDMKPYLEYVIKKYSKDFIKLYE